MPWDPARYSRFAGHRLRPAIDLLSRVDAEAPRSVVDLGCGTGNVTRLLAARWPGARITGVDSSPEMLSDAVRPSNAHTPSDAVRSSSDDRPSVNDRRSNADGAPEGAAESNLPEAIAWQRADIADWRADPPVDVLFSNAALHWLPDHRRLVPRLLDSVAEGGWLAVQMPRNWDAPSHATVEELARLPQWTAQLGAVPRPASLPPAEYYEALAGRCRSLDLWETTYVQALPGDNAVAEWTRGTFLLPFLDALPEPQRWEFEDEYRRRMAIAYPRRSDGITLYPFRRVFIVARR